MGPPFDWRFFLEGYSRDLLAGRQLAPRISVDVRRSQWLGYAGATAEQIQGLEARLSRPLPPSYRAFLLTSNGWRQTGPFIDRLYAAGEVDWFRNRYADWIEAWTGGPGHLLSMSPPSVPDGEYFVYGAGQDPVKGRFEYLNDALAISPEGDSAIYLLNPRVVSAGGEWEAWFFANWLPGAARYRSFQEMMVAERAQQAALFSGKR